MIGQSDIKDRINDLSQSVVIVGERGCGKHTLVDYISNVYSMEVVDISTEISDELVSDIYTSDAHKIYLIDIVKASDKKQIIPIQNSILKFIEEPPMYAKIIILAEYKEQLLGTILNRCQILSMRPYPLDEKIQILTDCGFEVTKDSDLLINFTPGQIMSCSGVVDEMKHLTDTIVDKIGVANASNILTIPSKLDICGGELPTDVFMKILKHKFVNKGNINAYYLTKEYLIRLRTLNVNKKFVLNEYLLNLKDVI